MSGSQFCNKNSHLIKRNTSDAQRSALQRKKEPKAIVKGIPQQNMSIFETIISLCQFLSKKKSNLKKNNNNSHFCGTDFCYETSTTCPSIYLTVCPYLGRRALVMPDLAWSCVASLYEFIFPLRIDVVCSITAKCSIIYSCPCIQSLGSLFSVGQVVMVSSV